MDRRHASRYGTWFLFTLCAAMLVTGSGCVAALATIMHVVKGPNVAPKHDIMREKKVAVVCRQVGYTPFQNPTVPREIAQRVNLLLKKNVPRIEMVDYREVDEWIDNNTWDEALEVGQALDADLVLGIDMEQFSLYEGHTLYKGKADLVLRVYDCATGELLVDEPMPRTVYPPNHVRSTSEQQESEFCREFVSIIADQIGRYFYPHDPGANFAADAAAMR